MIVVIRLVCIFAFLFPGYQSYIFSKIRYIQKFQMTKNDDPSSKTDDEIRAILRDRREDNSQNSLESLRDFAQLDKELMASLKSKRPYFSLLSEQFMQTIDDMQLAQRTKAMQKISEANYSSNSIIKQENRPRIVVLGTGWGAYSFLKTIDTTMYNVVVVSPRNYFLFTPMLAASAVGTVEFRSITEPIRNVNPMADYLEAQARSLDIVNKIVNCESIKCEGTACEFTEFAVPYDHLVVAVGATTNTFGVKGVKEHCLFLKQVEDAASLRKAIAYCFERANVPGLSEEEKRNSLSFVIVGAGPTGVEFTAELRDFMESEGRRYYPSLLRYAKISLVEAGGAVLQALDEALQKEALQKLRERPTSLIKDGYIDEEMVEVVLQTGVKEVTDSSVLLSSGRRVNYGFCLWAAGNGPVPLVLDIIEQIELQKTQQSKARGRLVTDSWLRVEGVQGIYSLGDCSFIDGDPLPATAQVASQQGGYLGRLFTRGFDLLATPAPLRLIESSASSSSSSSDSSSSSSSSSSRLADSSGIDATSESVGNSPVTVATSTFASELVGVGRVGKAVDLPAKYATETFKKDANVEVAKPFQFLNLGILAYIGASEALAQINVDKQLVLGSGQVGYLLWRGIYWTKQVSWRNRVLVAFDWIKGRLFGRDIGALYL